MEMWLKMNSDDHSTKEKRDFTIEKQSLYEDFTIWWNFFPFSWLSEILELIKRLIIWFGCKGIIGVSKTFTVFNTLTRQLFLYFKISFVKSYAIKSRKGWINKLTKYRILFLDIPSLICFLRSFPLSSNALFCRFKFRIARDASDIT